MAVHILELPKLIAVLPNVPPFDKWVLDPKEAAYLLLIGGAICFGALIHVSPLPRNRVLRLGQLIDELDHARQVASSAPRSLCKCYRQQKRSRPPSA